MCVYMYIFHLSIYLSICLSVCLSIFEGLWFGVHYNEGLCDAMLQVGVLKRLSVEKLQSTICFLGFEIEARPKKG